MMHGYLAVKPDFQTVEGLVFYEQAETPGLGGEVKSQKFKDAWPGKKLFADNGDVQIRVIKNAPQDDHSIDALSGATITSDGVTNALDYWLGPEGFKPFIDRKKGESSPQTASGKAMTGANNG
jgi:Na+-transporting NADH:ubiquinone oxidoreductase subunit C